MLLRAGITRKICRCFMSRHASYELIDGPVLKCVTHNVYVISELLLYNGIAMKMMMMEIFEYMNKKG